MGAKYMDNWHDFFLKLCDLAASKSKDIYTKIGAAIRGSGNEVVSIGYNGLPRGVNDDVEERQQRPTKYFWFEHAERNAIYNVARRLLQGTTLYVQMYPCADCARAIIQVGIAKVVIANKNLPPQWTESMKVAETMFKEAGVEVEWSK